MPRSLLPDTAAQPADDPRDHQSEGRRRQDDDRDQSRRGARRRGCDPARRSRPAGQQLDVVPRRSRARSSIYDALTDPAVAITDVIRQAEKVPNLSIAPVHIALAKIEAKLLGELDSHFRLKDELEPIQRKFDYVIIDTPPTLGIITVNALVAATHVLIPIQSSYFALEGTDDLLETIDKIKVRANPQLQILGALITLYDKRTLLAKDIHDQIQQVFGDKLFETVITKSVRLEESPAYRESIFTFAPRSTRRLRVLQAVRGGPEPCLSASGASAACRCGSRCATTATSSRS